VDEWLYNGGPYQLIVCHFFLGICCYMGREWELSYRLGMRPWIAVAYSAPVAAATAVFIIYPIGQGSFSDGMPLGISGTFNFMIVFQAEHNILMHPFHMLGKNYASPPVYFLYLGTLICFCLPINILAEKGGLKTRLNGGSSFLGFSFRSRLALANRARNEKKKEPSPGSSVNFFFYEKKNNPFERKNLLSKVLSFSHSEINDSNMNNPVPNHMAPRQLPGVYMILCLENNKRYYGESGNVSSRLSNHRSRLRRNIHEVAEMQRDFNLYGADCFQFSAIFLSTDCTKEKRKALEIEYIARHYDICYNKFEKSSRKKQNNPFFFFSKAKKIHKHSDETKKQISRSLAENRKLNDYTSEGLAIMLKGQKFPSISEASRQTNHSRDTIRRWLNDPNNLDCIQIDTSKPHPNQQVFENRFVENTGIPKVISLHGVKYASIAQASRELECSRANIQRLLRTDPENCFFL